MGNRDQRRKGPSAIRSQPTQSHSSTAQLRPGSSPCSRDIVPYRPGECSHRNSAIVKHAQIAGTQHRLARNIKNSAAVTQFDNYVPDTRSVLLIASALK